MASSSSSMAMQSFSLANDVKTVSAQDAIFRFDEAEDKLINKLAPWSKDPHYFKKCRISAIALIKMVIHARSGVPYEIMGLMQGKVVGDALVIHDSYALPVQGTETRVNAANEANEYMIAYLERSKQVARYENAIGWYHSHPGYGCWLSGIDVTTQLTNQKYQDPFVAVVVDPNRTISAGRVDIGAFRTYPEDYKPAGGSGGGAEYQSIPLEKIEDFGVHANAYYPLEVEIFKSSLDEELLSRLWNKYWVNTLSQSPLISNRAHAVAGLADLHAKLSRAQPSVVSSRATVPKRGGKKNAQAQGEEKKQDEHQLAKGARDATRLASEAQHGLIAQVLKDVIFSHKPDATRVAAAADTLDTAMIVE